LLLQKYSNDFSMYPRKIYIESALKIRGGDMSVQKPWMADSTALLYAALYKLNKKVSSRKYETSQLNAQICKIANIAAQEHREKRSTLQAFDVRRASAGIGCCDRSTLESFSLVTGLTGLTMSVASAVLSVFNYQEADENEGIADSLIYISAGSVVIACSHSVIDVIIWLIREKGDGQLKKIKSGLNKPKEIGQFVSAVKGFIESKEETKLDECCRILKRVDLKLIPYHARKPLLALLLNDLPDDHPMQGRLDFLAKLASEGFENAFVPRASGSQKRQISAKNKKKSLTLSDSGSASKKSARVRKKEGRKMLVIMSTADSANLDENESSSDSSGATEKEEDYPEQEEKNRRLSYVEPTKETKLEHKESIESATSVECGEKEMKTPKVKSRNEETFAVKEESGDSQEASSAHSEAESCEKADYAAYYAEFQKLQEEVKNRFHVEVEQFFYEPAHLWFDVNGKVKKPRLNPALASEEVEHSQRD
jgi:hypothetical protein